MNLIIIVGGLYTEMAVNFMNDARDWDNYIDTDIDCNLAFLSQKYEDKITVVRLRWVTWICVYAGS